MLIFKCNKPRSTYEAFQLALFSASCAKIVVFLHKQHFEAKRVYSKNRIEIRSILQIYLRGAHSPFQASRPGGTMIRPCLVSHYLSNISCKNYNCSLVVFVKVMPKILAIVSFVILTNLYFRISKVVQQRI